MQAFTLTTILLSSLLTCALSAREATIQFTDKQKLSGDLTEITSKHIKLKHPDFKKPVQWNISDLAQLQIKGAEGKSLGNRAVAKVTLHPRVRKNLKNDIHYGAINKIDNDFIYLDTQYAGPLQLRMKFVKRLDIEDSQKIAYDGPGKLAEWKQSFKKNSITQDENGTIYFHRLRNNSGARAIYREVKFPEKYEVVFESDGRARNNSFTLSLHYGKGKAKKNSCIDFEVSNYQAYVTLAGNSPQREHVARFDNPIQQLKGKITYRFFIDQKKKECSLYINGIMLLNRCKLDKLDLKSLGKNLAVRSNHTYNSCNFKRITVQKWNGAFPTKKQTSQIALRKREDPVIKLSNGDFIFGKITKIQDELAYIKTRRGEFKIPLVYVSNLEINSDKDEGIKQNENDAKFHFADGSTFIAKIIEIKNGKITATSQAFEGVATFDLSQLTQIEFEKSIYSRR